MLAFKHILECVKVGHGLQARLVGRVSRLLVHDEVGGLNTLEPEQPRGIISCRIAAVYCQERGLSSKSMV